MKRKGKKFQRSSNSLNKLSLFQKSEGRFNRSCPLSLKNAPIIDYKNISILKKYISENNKILSSTLIRKKISLGMVKKAKSFLGRNWSIEGTVIKGRKRGRKIGFPTCNIRLKDYIIPKLGVYSILAETDKFKRKGIANIGYRPTFNGKTLLLEVNIFGIKTNLYKKVIDVNFIKFIRGEKKFNSINELKIQIKKDIKKANN